MSLICRDERRRIYAYFVQKGLLDSTRRWRQMEGNRIHPAPQQPLGKSREGVAPGGIAGKPKDQPPRRPSLRPVSSLHCFKNIPPASPHRAAFPLQLFSTASPTRKSWHLVILLGRLSAFFLVPSLQPHGRVFRPPGFSSLGRLAGSASTFLYFPLQLGLRHHFCRCIPLRMQAA